MFIFGSESDKEWKVSDIIHYCLSIMYLVFVQKDILNIVRVGLENNYKPNS